MPDLNQLREGLNTMKNSVMSNTQNIRSDFQRTRTANKGIPQLGILQGTNGTSIIDNIKQKTEQVRQNVQSQRSKIGGGQGYMQQTMQPRPPMRDITLQPKPPQRGITLS